MVRAEDGKLHSHLEWLNIAIAEDGLKLNSFELKRIQNIYYSSHARTAYSSRQLSARNYIA